MDSPSSLAAVCRCPRFGCAQLRATRRRGVVECLARSSADGSHSVDLNSESHDSVTAKANLLKWLQRGGSAQAEVSALFPTLRRFDVLNTTSSYSIVIRALGKEQMWQDALDLFTSMSFYSSPPDLVAYTAVLTACESTSQWEKAVWLLEDMGCKTVLPDMACYRNAISSCEKSGQWEFAVGLLREMPNVRYAPDGMTYYSAMRACLNGGQHVMAASIEEELMQRSSAAKSNRATTRRKKWSLLIEGAPRKESSKQLWLSSIANRNTPPQEYLDAVTQLRLHKVLQTPREYQLVMTSFGHRSMWRSALRLLVDIREGEVTPDAQLMSSAIHVCNVARQWEFVLLLVREFLNTDSPDAVLFYSLTDALSKGGQWRKAWDILRTMQPTWGVSPSIGTYTHVISALKLAGPWELGNAVLDRMKSSLLEADCATYGELVAVCERRKQWAQALAVLEGARQRSVRPDLSCCDAAIRTCERAGRWEAVCALLAKMRRQNFEPSQTALSSAIGACVNAEKYSQALPFVRDYLDSAYAPDSKAYDGMIRICAAKGEWSGALHLLSQMWEVHIYPATSSYNSVMRSCQIAHLWNEVLSLLEDMQSHAVPPNKITYDLVFEACEHGSNAAARDRR